MRYFLILKLKIQKNIKNHKKLLTREKNISIIPPQIKR